MKNKKKEKVIYLLTNADKKTHLINLYSLPTKCPICHSFQKPDLISFQYNENDDAKVHFRCMNNKCKSSFSAFYIKCRKVKDPYHFICFI